MKRVLKSLVLLAFVGLLVLGAIAFDDYLDPFNDQAFDRELWMGENEQRRGPMARDTGRMVVGLDVIQVIQLLGKPDAEGDPRYPYRKGRYHQTWTYWLGCWSALGWYGYDSADLIVHFDAMGRVVATEVDGG